MQQLCTDTVCSLEDLPEAMDEREGNQEMVREIHGDDATWWWWWWSIYAGRLWGNGTDGLCMYEKLAIDNRTDSVSPNFLLLYLSSSLSISLSLSLYIYIYIYIYICTTTYVYIGYSYHLDFRLGSYKNIYIYI